MVAILRGPATGNGETFVIFSRDGDATVETGEHRFPLEEDIEVLGLVLAAGGAPGGDDLIFDLVVDAFDGGGSIYPLTADKPTILDGEHEATTPAPANPLVAAGHYLTVDILQVGSPTPGSKIDVRVLYRVRS